MSYRHPQAYKALHTKGITTIALPYVDCIVWGHCGETLAFAGSKIWNEIPKEIRMAKTLHKHLATQRHSHHDSLVHLSLRECGDP